MTEAILDRVRIPSLSDEWVDKPYHIAVTPGYDTSIGLIVRIDEVLSDHFRCKLEHCRGEDAVKGVVVFTKDVRDPETGEVVEMARRVDLSNPGWLQSLTLVKRILESFQLYPENIQRLGNFLDFYVT